MFVTLYVQPRWNKKTANNELIIYGYSAQNGKWKVKHLKDEATFDTPLECVRWAYDRIGWTGNHIDVVVNHLVEQAKSVKAERIPGTIQLADVPPYQHVHGFRKAKYPGDGFWYCREQVKPWCVYYAYAGHYFSRLDDALQYAARRRFIPVVMIGSIKQKMNENGFI